MEHVAGPEDIPHTLEPGFYLWEGDIDCVQVRKGDDRYDDYVYEGSYRKIKAIDAEKFIGLKPPQEEEEG